MSQEHKDVTSVWQVVKFTLFSISAGLIQIAAFTLMETVFHLPYWPSYLTALVLSVLWNFTFNRRYTFRSDASRGAQHAAGGAVLRRVHAGFHLVGPRPDHRRLE